MKNKMITQEDIMKILDTCYAKALDGIPLVSSSVEDMAKDYLKKHSTKEEAIKAMLKNQITKCSTSGFITGFGGFITMPVTIPANITSVLYIQIRMIACSAYMMDYDLKSDQAQTFVYACLAGVSLNAPLKAMGIKFGEKMAQSLIKKIPRKTLTTINKKVGFRFITKLGSKGIINMGKLVPVLGAAISGGFDLVETKIIADRTFKWFCQDDFIGDDKFTDTDDIIIDIDFIKKENEAN